MPSPPHGALEARIEAARSTLEPLVAATPEADLCMPAALAVVEAGLHTVVLPRKVGGLDPGLSDAARMLSAIGAIDGSIGLGLAMHTQVVGGAIHGGAWPPALLESMLDGVAGGALVNSASTEEGSGSPARGGLPSTTARPEDDGETFVLDGEKTWTTWLPALRFAIVSARLQELHEPEARDGATDAPTIVTLLVDLESQGVERLPGFSALGMRGSASGRLRLDGVRVPGGALVARRPPGAPDVRGPMQQIWFGICVSAVYLGIGEGARARVVRWAIDRRPGDDSTAVADLPTIHLRLGRLDAALRSARMVLLGVAARADATPGDDRAALAAIAADVTLAKLTVSAAAVTATDEALRIAGGPGFLDGPLERAFRDARAGLINPPLEDVALGTFGRALVERARAAGG